MRLVASAGDGDERGEAGAVVGDSRAEEAIAFATDFYFGGGGKDGVEGRGEHDDFFFTDAAKLADDVAGFVDFHVEAGRRKKSFDGGRALAFLERVGGEFRE